METKRHRDEHKNLLYQVIGWDEYFEGAKTKTYNNKTTCCMPCKHGLGYKRLIRHKHGPALFGAWCALVQILSRHPKKRQGYLTDTGVPPSIEGGNSDICGVPYTAEDISILSDIPVEIVQEMLDMCSSESVGWLVVTTLTDTGRISEDIAVSVQYPLNSNLNSNSNSNSNSKADSDHEDTSAERKKRKKPRSASSQELMVFEEFYGVYPRKQGRADALKAFLQQIDKGVLPDIEAIKKYLADKVTIGDWVGLERKFIPLPGSWLRGERWSDEVGGPPLTETGSGATRVCTERIAGSTKGKVYFIDKKTPDGCMNSTVGSKQFKENVASGEWVNCGSYEEWKKGQSA